MRTRTRGIVLNDDGTRTVDKLYRGERIYERLGAVTQDEAEAWLRKRHVELDTERDERLRPGHERLFAAAAAKYLTECRDRQVRTLDTISYHVELLLPYIGSVRLADVCNDSFEEFREDRLAEGRTPATINRTLEVARTVLNRAARVWRAGGRPWLGSSPLIEMLDESGARKPYPITWTEQAELLRQLPPHLQRMALFALNTGARDDNICGLRWEWERPVTELKRSVFLIPAAEFKSKRPHVLILNDAAWHLVEECRKRRDSLIAAETERGPRQPGDVDRFVFCWRRGLEVGSRAPAAPWAAVDTMNNTAWQNARDAAKLPKVRVHDLRHTFGHRLREAGVSEEDRALLLGHAIQGMPQHYAAATVARLVAVANKVAKTRDRTTLLRIVNS
ncbi:MAG: tyrosine-type recombinase/integrase [Rubrivivax sp.]